MAAIIVVFLLLAAMYESWRLPWAVLLGSPMVGLGAFFGCWLMGYDNNVYVQVGLVMLIGLAAKNAILIVEFAKAKHEEGDSLEDAALLSARLRFRPILMTAFAFILGVVPLMLANGAGAGAQNVMGTAVFWGMLVATALGVFLIPGNYTFIEGLGRKKKSKAEDLPADMTPPPSVVEHATFDDTIRVDDGDGSDNHEPPPTITFNSGNGERKSDKPDKNVKNSEEGKKV